MNKEKQIEEMAKIICNTCREKHISVSKNCKCKIGETCIAADVHSEALYNAGYRKETQFIENMKNVLEIEKKNAVKEFAEILKAKVTSYLYRTNFDGHTDNVIDHFELCEIIDKSAKEYLK